MDTYRNRVQEMKLMPAGELLDHEGNWRVHPQFQTEALDGSLQQVGIVDVLKAYYSERAGGKLVLLDGHDRKSLNPEQVWPVIILDIDDEEADAQLAIHDTIGSWAEIDALKLQSLIDKARYKNQHLRAAAERIAGEIAEQVAIARRAMNDPDAPEKPKRLFDFQDMIDASVKVVIPVGPDLALVEKAIKATGVKRRGGALTEICKFYLENRDEGSAKG